MERKGKKRKRRGGTYPIKTTLHLGVLRPRKVAQPVVLALVGLAVPGVRAAVPAAVAVVARPAERLPAQVLVWVGGVGVGCCRHFCCYRWGCGALSCACLRAGGKEEEEGWGGGVEAEACFAPGKDACAGEVMLASVGVRVCRCGCSRGAGGAGGCGAAGSSRDAGDYG